MNSLKQWIPVALVIGMASVALMHSHPSSAKDETPVDALKKTPMEVFMRKKLDASSKILEGLCQEDAALIETGANELSAMSKAELWNVLTDADYREHSREFRDNAMRVAAAAKEGDFDKAALRWFDVTMSCLECHETVRKGRTEKSK